jgi:hypothetical protein
LGFPISNVVVVARDAENLSRSHADGGRPTLIQLAYGQGLKLDDCLPDAKPDKLSLMIAEFEHLIGPTC